MGPSLCFTSPYPWVFEPKGIGMDQRIHALVTSLWSAHCPKSHGSYNTNHKALEIVGGPAHLLDRR